MDDIYASLLYAATLTVLIETGISFFLFNIKDKKDLLNIALINVLTNIILNTICICCIVFFGTSTKYVVLLIMEILVIVFEGLFYSYFIRYLPLNPSLFSIVLNVSSYLLGEIISKLLF